MDFHTLIEDLPLVLRLGRGDVALQGLTDDSRSVVKGGLFVVRPATDVDPLRFVPSAVKAGAAALLLPDTPEKVIAQLELPDSLSVACALPGTSVDQRLCGKLAERFYGHPSRQLKLIGVTGTNGKTTTVTITKHLLDSAGYKCGLIGTVLLDTGSTAGPTPATLTTPGAIELSRLLAEMLANGCDFCVMEVSSHALHQGRADHLRFSAAAFTNLTQDHLDYHGTMEAYADAKAILFEALDLDATAVLNIETPYASRMAQACAASILHTAAAIHTHADCMASTVQLNAGSSQADFIGPWGNFQAALPMPGLHNLSNAIQALTLAHAVAKLDSKQLKHGLETCRPVPGRLEPVGPDWPQVSTRHNQLPTVLVDYAHTPDALINVGSAMRQLTKGKLIIVFGCGGDRDRAKRPLMALAAQQYADVVVLTSDNPRTEDPQQILADAQAGFGVRNSGFDSTTGTNTKFQNPKPETRTIADRSEAIRFAINLADVEDTVLIAGKGHEDYQIIGKTKHHFDDREQAAAALREKMNQPS